ncbi:YafY family transcriptional regulator [Nocardioides dongxiaopingii]|uniref:helix-turn-helix transcriptional regulator n=1 Tax=Nocardioides sp. S-1144 TaxID=2582905 RepID=UPI00116505A8|nr:YafY family protein [Nocardioides sp. S-1144]QDH11015.1 YafY family transcriptional regulator [Nocardioides sp. S-1144]
MADGTTQRVLRLLTLLQQRRTWTGTELAGELGVTDRCVRRDVGRLRDLGYPVHASQGVGGGYQLGAGKALPPLLLDDDEAIAIAVSLRLAAGGTVAGTGEAALRTLAKLDQVMPPRLRSEVRTLHGATETLPGGVAQADGEVLTTLARACRDAVRVRFGYTSRGGGRQERTVEPVRMVATGRRWYLMAFDVDRDDWRTFRLDRMADVVATTWRVPPREHPDPAAFVQRAVTAAPYRHVVRARVSATAAQVRELLPPQVGAVEPDGDAAVLTAGGDQLDWLAVHLALLPWPVEVLEPDALRDVAAELGRRLARMAR